MEECVLFLIFVFKWVTSPGTSQKMLFLFFSFFVLQLDPFGQLYFFKVSY